ncbi:MAG: hypothetical protein SNJ64_04565 [Endomicrobiia bacterium]
MSKVLINNNGDFLLLKSNKDLNYYKKKLLELLEEDILKSYPIGTVRDWKRGKFKKIRKNKWVKIYEGESRGQKQAVSNIRKKIKNAKTIEELIKIVLENKNRFKDENGKIHPVVKEILKEVKGRGLKSEKKDTKIKEKKEELVL